ncbi:hypothetical protein [Tolumonas lignilytica]|uniref:hypothetical protein n=1 Tax=Tolumonas lignilytica TaxID=1283284 RepID=UPI00046340E3|nr:hypothetical protein [Tolumonas lignilytica]
MVNVEKLQKEHFISYDLVLPHFHGYPIRVITASCPWSEEHLSANILNVAVTLPGEDGVAQLKQMLKSIDVTPGE